MGRVKLIVGTEAAALELGIHKRTLLRKLAELNITPSSPERHSAHGGRHKRYFLTREIIERVRESLR